ncbi:MAG: bacteriohemerythrin [Treponema sp.]|jgi:hemerythrin|nr:bacteriohemerythrin [Treponema sp.]
MEDNHIVEWDTRYKIGIPVIDEQHKKLIAMTNDLYTACLGGKGAAKDHFRKTVREAVDYVRFHFSTEEKILDRINYPETAAHKKQHEDFVKEIIRQVQAFEGGRQFVPNVFVRFLRDWVLTHIAVSDKAYSEYLMDLKKRGMLFSPDIKPAQAEVEVAAFGGSS